MFGVTRVSERLRGESEMRRVSGGELCKKINQNSYHGKTNRGGGF